MKLPFADRAVIAPEKLRDYLLSPTHPTGAAKAVVFTSVGYERDGWWLLQHDLKDLARANEADDFGYGRYGQKFAVRGILHGPAGQALSIVTIWMVRHGERFPRFVTAYPRRSG
jgi:hypothetical protein